MNTLTACARSILSAGVLLVAGCNDGTGTGSTATTGPVTVAISGGSSPEVLLFEVDVTEVRLRRQNGQYVSMLSEPVRVDLAAHEDLPQVLASARLSSGTYTGAALTLGMADAKCVLRGRPTPAAIRDANGVSLTGSIEIPLEFASSVLVTPRTSRLVELLFDLRQSLVVDAAGNVVEVEPAVQARADRPLPRDVAFAGTLASVDTQARSFLGALRSRDDAVVSHVALRVTDTTTFQVNGVASSGTAGFGAFSVLPTDTWLHCRGSIAASGEGIEALYVEAGLGTSNGGSDVVEGQIVGRTGGRGSDAVLEVLGSGHAAAHTAYQYATSFLVRTSFADTRVLRRGWSAALGVDELNVGQRVRVFGSLSGSVMSANTTSSIVQQLSTRVAGPVLAAPVGSTLAIDLATVDKTPETSFD